MQSLGSSRVTAGSPASPSAERETAYKFVILSDSEGSSSTCQSPNRCFNRSA